MLKKYILGVVILITALSFLACGPSTSPPVPATSTPAVSMQEYVDSENGFSIYVPAGWTKRVEFTSTEQGADFIVVWENSDRTVAIVVGFKDSGATSQAEVIEQAKEVERRTGGDWRLLRSEKKERERVWLWYRITPSGGEATEGVQVAVLAHTQQFSVAGVGEPAIKFRESRGTVEYSLSTFRLLSHEPAMLTSASALRADFFAERTKVEEGKECTFVDLSSNNIASWHWDFGDGAVVDWTSETRPASGTLVHAYSKPGKYAVSLTVANAQGSMTEKKKDYIGVETGRQFTEFYIGPKDKPMVYPQTLTFGQEVGVTIGIVNREGRPTSFQVRVVLQGEEVARTGFIALGNLEKWEKEIRFTPKKAGTNQKLEFQLYREDAPSMPYMAPLYFWVDVRP